MHTTREELALELLLKLTDDPAWDSKCKVLGQLLAGPRHPMAPDLIRRLFDPVSYPNKEGAP